MNKKKVAKIITATLTLFVAFSSVCILEALEGKRVSAQTKTKWQGLLERNDIDSLLWEKYLPRVTRKEYLKVKKSLQRFVKKASESAASASNSNYPLHQNISTTFFWIGEDGSDDNHGISNSPSCWDEKWTSHFGGVDDPDERKEYCPSAFRPKENPFYFALPYNDFDSSGRRKSGLEKYIPWFGEKKWGEDESVCKNRWIKIIKGGKMAYAQWEDAGPFGEDDASYVFGTAQPKSKSNDHAGLDVSPAVRDYLSLADVDKTSWQFVDEKEVPDGPWKDVVTRSGIYWN